MVQRRVRPTSYVEGLHDSRGETTCPVECSINRGASIYKKHPFEGGIYPDEWMDDSHLRGRLLCRKCEVEVQHWMKK